MKSWAVDIFQINSVCNRVDGNLTTKETNTQTLTDITRPIRLPRIVWFLICERVESPSSDYGPWAECVERLEYDSKRSRENASRIDFGSETLLNQVGVHWSGRKLLAS